jgi:hypothetical protein
MSLGPGDVSWPKEWGATRKAKQEVNYAVWRRVMRLSVRARCSAVWGCDLTLSTTTEPFWPELLAMRRSAYGRARLMMSAPTRCSSFSSVACIRA